MPLLTMGLALCEMFNFSVMVCPRITKSANTWFFSKYVVSRNFEFYSVVGKQKHLCFLLIFFKVYKLYSAAILVSAVSASSVLVSSSPSLRTLSVASHHAQSLGSPC